MKCHNCGAEQETRLQRSIREMTDEERVALRLRLAEMRARLRERAKTLPSGI